MVSGFFTGKIYFPLFTNRFYYLIITAVTMNPFDIVATRMFNQGTAKLSFNVTNHPLNQEINFKVLALMAKDCCTRTSLTVLSRP